MLAPPCESPDCRQVIHTPCGQGLYSGGYGGMIDAAFCVYGPAWLVHRLRGRARPIAPSRRVARAPHKSAGKSSPIGRGRVFTAAASRRSPEVGFLKGQGDLEQLKALGRHIVCELSGCRPSLLSDISAIAAMMIAAANAARATIMESAFHRFEPQGVSGTVICGRVASLDPHLAREGLCGHGFLHVPRLTSRSLGCLRPCGAHAESGRACWPPN